MTLQEERELGRILRDRASLIERVPDYASQLTEDIALPVGHERSAQSRSLVLARVAVLVVLLLAVGCLAFVVHERIAAPSAGQCSPAGSGTFAVALGAGTLPAGARVLSVGRDGAVLVADDHDGTTSTVQLVSASGAVLTLWRAQGTDRFLAVANPSGAFGDQLVAFLLRPASSASAPRVYYSSLDSGVTRQLPIAVGHRPAVDPELAPISMDDAVEVMETSAAHHGLLRAAFYEVDPTLPEPTYGAPLSRVRALLSVGGNDVVVQRRPDGRSTLVFGDPTAEPTTLGPAAVDGVGFISDGTTMSWVRPGRPDELTQWSPGDPAPVTRRVPASAREPVPAGGTLVSGRSDATDAQRVADAATGHVAMLPHQFSVVRATNSVAVLARATRTGVESFRVPIQSLAGC